ncbi:hypothetical protein DI273_22325 [Streptomyces violascens]|nr:hypothetical protein DI273_22325 [Streptomyces violascens]
MMTQYTPPPVVRSLLADPRPVVLFGAGDIGVLAHHVLTRLGVAVTCFADGRVSKQGTVLRGLPVRPVADLAELADEAYVFLCGNYLKTMTDRVRGAGFTRIQDCVDLLDGFDFSDSGADTGMSPVLMERKAALHKRETRKDREHAEDTLILKYLDVVVTEACSMKCQDCSNLMQYYTKPRHSDLDLLESAVDRIMDSVDGIYEFRVLGGEPFVNPRVHRVIEKLTAYEVVEKVVVYTNGTIVPRGANLECLRDEKVVVEITNYGEHSKKLDALEETLTAEGSRTSRRSRLDGLGPHPVRRAQRRGAGRHVPQLLRQRHRHPAQREALPLPVLGQRPQPQGRARCAGRRDRPDR